MGRAMTRITIEVQDRAVIEALNRLIPRAWSSRRSTGRSAAKPSEGLRYPRRLSVLLKLR